MKLLILLIALLSAAMPVITQKTGLSKKYPLSLKMLCAFLFLSVAVLSVFAAESVTAFSLCILAALVKGALGDFFLSYKKEKYFMLGLLFFALGHLIYSYTFLYQGIFSVGDCILPALTVTAMLTFVMFLFSKSKLRLGRKQLPFTLYSAILIFFFICSVTSGIRAIIGQNILFGLCLISGGTLFIFSDLLIGMRAGGIKRPKFLHYAVSYTYFSAQTLFALSILFQQWSV